MTILETLVSMLKSRTVWTVLVMMAVTQVQFLQPFMSVELFALVQSILSALAIYFRVTPKQNY